MTRKLLSVILALMLVLTLTIPTMAASIDTASTSAVVEQSAELTFSNSVTMYMNSMSMKAHKLW